MLLIFGAVFILPRYKEYLENKYKQKYLATDKTAEIDPDRSLFEQCGELPYDHGIL